MVKIPCPSCLASNTRASLHVHTARKYNITVILFCFLYACLFIKCLWSAMLPDSTASIFAQLYILKDTGIYDLRILSVVVYLWHQNTNVKLAKLDAWRITVLDFTVKTFFFSQKLQERLLCNCELQIGATHYLAGSVLTCFFFFFFLIFLSKCS